MLSGLVSEVVAIGVPDERLGQAVVLVAVAAGEPGGDAARVLGYAREKLPAYMVPRSVLWWPALPRNPNGKFDRVRIKAELLKAETLKESADGK